MIHTPRYTGLIPELNELNVMLDKIKAEVFSGTSNAAFLGSLLCSHAFKWVEPNDPMYSAATDGLTIWWNKADFMRCDLTEKQATLLHELWHTGFMHGPRRGDRDARVWNVACDHVINLMLIANGFNLPKNGWWVFDFQYVGWCEEDIYDDLIKNPGKMPKMVHLDLKDGPTSPSEKNDIIAAVVRAVQAADMAGKAGDLPGSLKGILSKFLEPKVDWHAKLYRWMTNLTDDGDYSWRHPSRRYHFAYMPSIQPEEGALEDELAYIMDSSGSIDEDDRIRFNSEVKHIKEVLQPEKLTVVQFDTKIQYEKTYPREEPFPTEIEMHGYGGTNLECVRKWINKHRPKAAIIFSDLECEPMKPLDVDTSIIWVKVHNNGYSHQPSFGELIQIGED